MTMKLKLLVGTLALAVASRAGAQSGEPLVWTPLADPDPDFVPPPEPRPVPRSRKALKPQPARASKDQEAYEAGRSLAETLKAIEAVEQAIAQTMENASGSESPPR